MRHEKKAVCDGSDSGALCLLIATAFTAEEFYTLDYVGCVGTIDPDVTHVYGIVTEVNSGYPKAEAARFETAVKRIDESLR